MTVNLQSVGAFNGLRDAYFGSLRWGADDFLLTVDLTSFYSAFPSASERSRGEDGVWPGGSVDRHAGGRAGRIQEVSSGAEVMQPLFTDVLLPHNQELEQRPPP